MTEQEIKGLEGEVKEQDCYRIKDLPFVPDMIVDCGANIGVFTHFCHELFPEASIVSVEPDKKNFAILNASIFSNKISILNAAIGRGQVYHGLTAANGSGETYLNAGIGYPDMEGDSSVEKSAVSTTMLDQLIRPIDSNNVILVKIDIEGNEKEIFTHEPSMEVLRKCDYVCMEVHRYAQHGGAVYDEVVEATNKALKSFDDTHYCEEIGVHFWAIKKKWGRLPEQAITSRAQLVTLLKRLRLPLLGVELGVAEGLFSADLLSAGMDKLIMVDAWTTMNQEGDAGFPQKWHDNNYRQAIERVAKFGNKAQILKGLTTKMASHVADKSLGLVYVDAAHDYTSVMADINAWYPKLVVGGVCAFHDYNPSYKGLMNAIEEFTDVNGIKRYPLPEKAEKDRGVYFIKP